MKNFMQVIIVTGASRGIGLEVCSQLLQQDHKVLGVSRALPSSVPQIAALAAKYSSTFHYEPIDISAPLASEKIVSICISKFGVIHGYYSLTQVWC